MSDHAIRMTAERAKQLQEKAIEQGWARMPGTPVVMVSAIEPTKPKRSKHGSVKTVVDGIKFDSKLEACVWVDLKWRERVGQIKNLRRQVAFSLYAPGGYHLRVWRADYVFEERIIGGDGWMRIVGDAKSAHTRPLPGWKETKALMQACHSVTGVELP